MLHRRTVGVAVAAALAVAVVAGGGAGAQDAVGDDPSGLLQRLDDLDVVLPAAVPPEGVDLTAGQTWGELITDATEARAMIDAVEPDLRELFADADDAAGDVADAVALVARGWLDVWTGVASLSAAEDHDVAFPVATTDAEGTATGADEVRTEVEVGVELLLEGHARLLEGYTLLRSLDEAGAPVQARLNERAEAAETYDEEIRPRLRWMVSSPTVTVAVPTDRFETPEPGVVSRASSLEILCVDREALEAEGGVATEEVLARIGVVERVGCPQPPDGLG